MIDDIVSEFLTESAENLDLLDRSLVDLEKNPSDRNTLASVFRTIHTIKGTCGFLGFTKLEKLAHVGENLLSLLRDGQLTLNPEITTVLLRMVDAIRQMLAEIQATEHDGEEEYNELMEELARLQSLRRHRCKHRVNRRSMPSNLPQTAAAMRVRFHAILRRKLPLIPNSTAPPMRNPRSMSRTTR